MQDIKLKIRHAKRGNEKSLDLSGMGLSELPVDITQLTMLEQINLSNNKLSNLRRIEQLPNLRELNASNNLITQLHQEMLDMWSIESLHLYGNPVVNSHPYLAQIDNNQDELKKALQQYFGGKQGAGGAIQTLSGSFNASGSSTGPSPSKLGQIGSRPPNSTLGTGFSTSNLQGGSNYGGGAVSGLGNMSKLGGNQTSTSGLGNFSTGGQQNYGMGTVGGAYQMQGTTGASQYGLSSGRGMGMNNQSSTFLSRKASQGPGEDAQQLKQRIQMLELENKQLKEQHDKDNLQMKKQNTAVTNDDRNWMSSFGASSGAGGAAGRMAMPDRPMTASSQNARVREVQEELKRERKEKNKLIEQIDNLKNEIQKQNFQAFTHSSSSVSVNAGRLPAVPGVREITIDDIEIGEKIGQGGFSTIHVGKLNGTPVAIKKIFDPRLTDELLNEIQNEIVMQSILRHPNIAMLMGVIPQIPNIYIVFEHVQQGSLYDMLHVKKQMTQLTLAQRLQIAIDASIVFEYMHHLGIAHRDIKSHNILIDHSFNVKVCDFGLAKFTADIGKGSMQYAGTPTYMAPELFQKRQYDHSVDIFAFGSLLWEIINRKVPYDGLDPSDIGQKVIRGEKLEDHALVQVDMRLADCVEACRCTEPAKRPSFKEITALLNQVKEDFVKKGGSSQFE